MYKMIGSIPEKDQAMLEERIKRSSKNRPPEPEPIGQPTDLPRQRYQPKILVAEKIRSVRTLG